jgi:hypothetical protein
MKRALINLGMASLVFGLAACGTDNTTTFVLQSGTPNASASASGSASASPSDSGTVSPAPSSPSTATATPIPGNLRIIIDSPDGGTPISSPVDVSGTASVANGAVLVVVRDASGKELGRATTTASAARPDYGHFEVSVSFSGATPGAKGEIRVMDAATQKNYYFINIRFS